MRVIRHWPRLAVAVLVLMLGTSGVALAIDPTDLTNAIEGTRNEFVTEFSNGQEVLAGSAGYLICPQVKKAGLVFGLESGICGMQIDGKMTEYYKVSGASWGMIAGVQKHSLILTFRDDEALSNFRDNDRGWELGVDASVSVATVGGGKTIDTTNMKEAVTAFAFGHEGLMADLSLAGSTFKKIEMDAVGRATLVNLLAIVDISAKRGMGPTARLEIDIDRWATAEERKAVGQAIKMGEHDKLTAALAAAEPMGTITQVGHDETVAIKYAFAGKNADGVWRVTLATGGTMPFTTNWPIARSGKYGYAVLQLDVNDRQVGDGAILLGADLEWQEDTGTVRIRQGDTTPPIPVTSVSAGE